MGRFFVCEHLGSGDLGCAYRAFEPGLGSVVVKLLTGLQDAEAEDRKRFVTLAWRLATVRHPNLPFVFEFGDHEGAPYLVVQHLRGSSRARRLRRGAIDRPAAMLSTLRAVASAVDHAHALGLVHGSLRPQQVLLEDDHPFLTDLGLAGLRWPGPGHLNAITLAGAAPYAAPELVVGGDLSAAADRYAFATMAYELLTGRTPFHGELHQVVSAQLLSEPPAPSRLNQALGSGFDDVLLRGLAKLPENRWPSCVEMTDALVESLQRKSSPLAGEVAAPVAPPQTAGARTLRWRRALAGAAAAATVAAGLGLSRPWNLPTRPCSADGCGVGALVGAGSGTSGSPSRWVPRWAIGWLLPGPATPTGPPSPPAPGAGGQAMTPSPALLGGPGSGPAGAPVFSRLSAPRAVRPGARPQTPAQTLSPSPAPRSNPGVTPRPTPTSPPTIGPTRAPTPTGTPGPSPTPTPTTSQSPHRR